jgi:hypothetical protein
MPTPPNAPAGTHAAPFTPRPASSRGFAAGRGATLLRLQAHWQMPAHPRYLAAANFTWQH